MNSQTNISQMGIGRVMAGVDQTIRQGQSSEIAATVAFLADDAAAFINGAEIVIDGGVTI